MLSSDEIKKARTRVLVAYRTSQEKEIKEETDADYAFLKDKEVKVDHLPKDENFKWIRRKRVQMKKTDPKNRKKDDPKTE